MEDSSAEMEADLIGISVDPTVILQTPVKIVTD